MSRRDQGDPPAFHRIRSTTSLLIIAVVLGVALAAALGGLVWLIASALHHASTS